jgi:hypothetical protein
MELSDILEVTDDLTQPRWVECLELPGFAVKLRLPDVPGMRGIATAAALESMKGEEGAPPPEFDPGAVSLKLIAYAVQDWRGLTGSGLRYFAAGVPNLQIKAEALVSIPFRRDLLQVLLKWSPRFYEFVDRSWRQLEIQGLKVREEDEKNSESAPATSPTPPPDTAAGARGKKKSSE